MKSKMFQIRMDERNLKTDMDDLNLFLKAVDVVSVSSAYVQAPNSFWSVLVFFNEADTSKSEYITKSGKVLFQRNEKLTEEENVLLLLLRKWRNEEMKKKGVVSFIICSNRQLITIAKLMPQTIDQLTRVSGFAGKKIDAIGQDIIDLVKKFKSENEALPAE